MRDDRLWNGTSELQEGLTSLVPSGSARRHWRRPAKGLTERDRARCYDLAGSGVLQAGLGSGLAAPVRTSLGIPQGIVKNQGFIA